MCDKYIYSAHISLITCALSLIKRKKPLKVCEDTEPELAKDNVSIESKQKKAHIWYQDLLRYIRENVDIIKSIDSLSPEHTSHIESLEIDQGKNVNPKAEWEKYLMKSKLQEEVLLKKDAEIFEVFSKGTKFMKSINFPTVIIKLPTGKLFKSMVYYAILEPETEEYCKIPCVVFSNPYGQKKTRFAEMLPLCFVKSSNNVCFTPMLRKKRYRHEFRKGCSFKVKLLIPGRSFDRSGEHSWNKYDVRSKDMRNLVKGFLEWDIRKLSLLMTKTVIPLKLKTKSHSGLRKEKASRKRKLRTSGNMNTHGKIPDEIAGRKFQTFYMNREPINSRGGSPISARFSNLSHCCTNMSSTWDIGSTFGWNSDNNLNELYDCRRISEIT